MGPDVDGDTYYLSECLIIARHLLRHLLSSLMSKGIRFWVVNVPDG